MPREISGAGGSNNGPVPGGPKRGKKRKAAEESEDEVEEIPMDDLPPADLDTPQKEYLLQFYKTFCKQKASKGTRIGANGKKYVDELIPDFITEFHDGLTEEARKRFALPLHKVCLLQGQRE
jgi:hypothetical protein